MVLRVKWPRPDGSGPEVATTEVGADSSAKNVYRALARIVVADPNQRSVDEYGYEEARPDKEPDKDLAKELKKLAKALLKQGRASYGFVDKNGGTITLELSLTGPARTRPVAEAEYDALEYVDQVATAVVPAVTFIAGTVFQETLQRAASDSYDGARRFFTALRNRVRRSRTAPPEPEAELTIMRSEAGRWTLRLPGNLDREAHAALIRDFDTLVREHGAGERFTVEWRGGRWVKSISNG
ncbi:hypothetical protein [Streptomyces sp. NPDC094032]|uniref:hypothetical protein n=1 Tax=Streptomyces sp. NPDC094032 TaxID=3155308 RepID=UPI00331CE5FE